MLWSGRPDPAGVSVRRWKTPRVMWIAALFAENRVKQPYKARRGLRTTARRVGSKNKGTLRKRGLPDDISDSSRCGPELATVGCLSRFGLGRSFRRKRLRWKTPRRGRQSHAKAPGP
jgi:hypothetical protein